MVQSKLNLNSDCRKGTFCRFGSYLVFWKSLGSKFLGKLAVKSSFVLSFRGVRLSRLVGCCLRGVVFGCDVGFVSQLIMLCEGGLGYGRTE
jgi:hypothetical protein